MTTPCGFEQAEGLWRLTTAAYGAALTASRTPTPASRCRARSSHHRVGLEQAKGPVAADDNSVWGCLKRIEDPDTGRPLPRAQLRPEMADMFLGAVNTTSQTCAITLCGPWPWTSWLHAAVASKLFACRVRVICVPML